MADITLRQVKGSPLTIEELDTNFINMNNDLGTKLSASSYTALDILAKLTTVDGAGSGLDADLLDGYTTSATASINTIPIRNSSGSIVASSFVGALTGNVTGNLIGNTTGTHTGNVTGDTTGVHNGNVIGNVTGNITGAVYVTGGLQLNGSAGTSGQVLVSTGVGSVPAWGNAFVTGMIMMWSGSIATVPTGWHLCDGTNGTPDLRNRMIVGAYQDDAGLAKTTITGSNTKTGGSKDAIVVTHSHTATVTDPGHDHVIGNNGNTGGLDLGGWSGPYMVATGSRCCDWRSNTEDATTGISVTNSTEGSSGTNANLPPYYALAYIMKL